MISWLRSQALRLDVFKPRAARVDDLLTPFPEVVEELNRRASDEKLRASVESYLGNLPPYFKEGNVLYLARHVATPNFETLRFIHLVETLGMQVVIGQDTKDKFVPHNPLKRALGRLPVCLGITKKDGTHGERYQKVTIVDFNTANGKPFSSIRTLWGEGLIDFHTKLLKTVASGAVRIEDDADWIDGTHRGSLIDHYKKFLALFLVHGVLFEDYLVEDKHEGRFVREVLRPAFDFVEKKFGCRPLITQLTPTSVESADYWMSYPKEVLDIVCDKLKNV